VLAANTNYNVDAADSTRSSFLRYANHSAQPNIFYTVIKVKRQRYKQIKFYTARPINAGEELVFDYGSSYWLERGITPVE